MPQILKPGWIGKARRMVRICFLLILLQGISLNSYSQEYLPDKMTGTWNGFLQIWSNGQKKDSVQVKLTILRIEKESWQWRMEYLSDKAPMVKDYRLKVKDREKNIFITDEGDGVELEDYAFGNKMYSLFETQDYWLTSTQELRNGKLIFEVTAGKKSGVLDKGVTNYSVTSMQRAVLSRQ